MRDSGDRNKRERDFLLADRDRLQRELATQTQFKNGLAECEDDLSRAKEEAARLRAELRQVTKNWATLIVKERDETRAARDRIATLEPLERLAREFVYLFGAHPISEAWTLPVIQQWAARFQTTLDGQDATTMSDGTGDSRDPNRRTTHYFGDDCEGGHIDSREQAIATALGAIENASWQDVEEDPDLVRVVLDAAHQAGAIYYPTEVERLVSERIDETERLRAAIEDARDWLYHNGADRAYRVLDEALGDTGEEGEADPESRDDEPTGDHDASH